MSKRKLKAVEVPAITRLDLACGKNKREGFVGVDALALPGVDQVVDLRQPWPWKDGSVEEVHASHFIEHLTSPERIHFFNELYRVLRVGGKATIITPHWASNRAYGDPTHQWPPVAEMAWYYLLRSWRTEQAPHTDVQWNPQGFSCDFDATWGYSLNPLIAPRNPEYQQHALQFFKEAATDMIATLTKREAA